MENQTDQEVFRVIETPEVREVTIECNLRPYGEAYTARLIRRSNFSDAFASAKTKFDKLADHYSVLYKTRVSEITVRLADRLARMWDHPRLPNGKKVSRDDLVKLSVENDRAFTALVESLDDEDVAETEEAVVEDFTPEAMSTLDT